MPDHSHVMRFTEHFYVIFNCGDYLQSMTIINRIIYMSWMNVDKLVSFDILEWPRVIVWEEFISL